MAFAAVVERETYRIRKSSAYKGDVVERRVREIGGRRVEFTRIFWGYGAVTVSACPAGRTDFLHYWEGHPVPLVCGHAPSYGCDCDTVAAEASG